MTGQPHPQASTGASSGRLSVIGMVGGEVFGHRARQAMQDAQVLVGSPRHLRHVATGDRCCIELTGPLDAILDRIDAELDADHHVAVLASGDPGFFGITRVLRDRFGHRDDVDLDIYPAPSSVALAWAAAGEPWDDAAVVSAHGRPLADAVEHARRCPKVAVLTSPENPPQRLGAALAAAGCPARRVTVASRLGEPDEQVVHTDLDGLVTGQFDPLAVVLLRADDVNGDEEETGLRERGPALSWGASTGRFDHRDGMITKPEVRAVVLAKLELAGATVLWDVGAGSGSVGIEAATICPGLVVHAIERHAADVDRIRRNAVALGVDARVQVHHARAPEVFDSLPRPDRIFVGGGGPAVLDAAWDHLPSGGVLVATFTVLEHAADAASRLDELMQLHVDRAVPVGHAGMRLEPTNPVFVGRGRR